MQSTDIESIIDSGNDKLILNSNQYYLNDTGYYFVL